MSLVAAAVVIAIVAWLFVPGQRVPARRMMQSYYRFVDPVLRKVEGGAGNRTITEPPAQPSLATATFPLGVIGDEARYVLSAPTQAVALYSESMAVPANGRLVLNPAVPRELGDAERVFVVPKVRAGTLWVDLPDRVVAVESSWLGRNVSVELDLPDNLSAKTVAVNIDVFALPRHAVDVYETPSVRIPSGATLEFATGILQPAWSEGPVEFAVRACEAGACEQLYKDVVDPATPAGQGWRDQRVSLRALGGKERYFVFETRALRSKDGAFSFPLWANPTVYAPASRPKTARNVILVSIDTLSARHLSGYGYGRQTTPFLDSKFGSEGVVFENCVAAATTTPPSHMSMFTSLPPCAHGLTTGFEVLSSTWATLAEVLRANSFETGAVTEDGWLDIKFAFGRGFNVFAENKSPDLMLPLGQIESTFQRARTWLVRHHEKPFFLFVHTFQVHVPYTPPAAYKTLFGEYDGQPIADDSPPAVREGANYDREIRYTDDQLRILWQRVSDLGLAENTVLILTSDHGEEFLEHGQWGHGANLYNEVTSVPLMFWLPHNQAAGRRIKQVVGHVDLLPTILDLVGVPIPPQATGRSLVPLLQADESPADNSDRAAYSEAWVDFAVEANGEIVEKFRPGLMVRLGQQKLLRFKERDGFRYELYDLSSDPLERTNLFAGGVGGELQSLIDSHTVDCGRLAATGVRIGAAPERAHLEPAQEEKLRALGYLR